MAEILVTVLHIVVCLFMILVVLVQGGNSGGMGAAFGGGSGSGSVLGATGATSLLGKLTYGAAAIFMCTSVILTVMGSDGDVGLKEQLQQEAEAANPAPGAIGESEKTETPEDK